MIAMVVHPFGLDNDAIERIVDAVGPEHTPPSLDRDHLRDSLNASCVRYHIQCRSSSRAAHKKRQQQARAIANHAGGLIELLETTEHILAVRLWSRYESDELYKGAPNRPPPLHIDSPDAPDFETLLAGLRALRAAAELEVKSEPGENGARKALVADYLAADFKRHFKREPGRSRHPDGGEVGGPYVRFVQAVTAVCGIPISKETVAAYLNPSRG